MKHLYSLLSLVLVIGGAQAQLYDFENLTTGATGNFSNGWVGSPTTGYSWRAHSDSTLSQGTGPYVDHTLGTTSGKYMYTEASSPAVAGNSATLTSPSISTASFSNPAISFWYHRAGTSMGNLYIDIYNGVTWDMAVDSLVGAQQSLSSSPWLKKRISLNGYSSPVQFRFRAICGSSWSGDMAIDDVDIEEMPPFDGYLMKVSSSSPYYMTPLEQVQSITLSAQVKNEGGDTLTNVTVSGLLNSTSITGSIASLAPTLQSTFALSPAYLPSSTGLYLGDFTISSSQTDTITINDSASVRFEISDTTFAREDGTSSQGIGFNGTGILGQVFELINPDTLSSISFQLLNGPVSQNVKVKLYGWNSTSNLPGAVIDSSAVFTLPSAGTNWFTLQTTCDQILAPGKYLVALEQLGTTNVSLAYTGDYFQPNTVFYNVGTGWTTLESAGFPAAVAIRANFGVPVFPTINLGSDTGFCANGSVVVTAPTGWASYAWSNGSTGQSVTVSTADSNFWVQVTDARGCKVRDTIMVLEYDVPTITMPTSAGICDGASITLVAANDPTYDYFWNTGSTDSSITVSTGGLYSVTVTSDQGCTANGFVSVLSGTTPVAEIQGSDTVYFCQGSSSTVTATGSGNIFSWSNGTTGASTQISQAGTFILTVTSPAGCVAYDTGWAIEQVPPTVQLSSTSISLCEGETETVNVNSVTGATYLWSTGATGTSEVLSQAGSFWVTTTLNGCSSSDSGTVVVFPNPVVDLGADTTICDTATLVLDAGSGSAFTWSNGATSSTISVNQAGTYAVTVENSNGCKGSDTITVNVETCVGVSEIDLNNRVNVYPNPATERIQISTDSDFIGATVRVFDQKGALVYSGVIQNEMETIQVDSWSKGVYQIQVTQSENQFRKTLVIQ